MRQMSSKCVIAEDAGNFKMAEEDSVDVGECSTHEMQPIKEELDDSSSLDLSPFMEKLAASHNSLQSQKMDKNIDFKRRIAEEMKNFLSVSQVLGLSDSEDENSKVRLQSLVVKEEEETEEETEVETESEEDMEFHRPEFLQCGIREWNEEESNKSSSTSAAEKILTVQKEFDATLQNKTSRMDWQEASTSRSTEKCPEECAPKEGNGMKRPLAENGHILIKRIGKAKVRKIMGTNGNGFESITFLPHNEPLKEVMRNMQKRILDLEEENAKLRKLNFEYQHGIIYRLEEFMRDIQNRVPTSESGTSEQQSENEANITLTEIASLPTWAVVGKAGPAQRVHIGLGVCIKAAVHYKILLTAKKASLYVRGMAEELFGRTTLRLCTVKELDPTRLLAIQCSLRQYLIEKQKWQEGVGLENEMKRFATYMQSIRSDLRKSYNKQKKLIALSEEGCRTDDNDIATMHDNAAEDSDSSYEQFFC